MTAIIDELTYRCYRHNRRTSPEVSPARWAALFGEDATAAMEARYQTEAAKS